MNMYSSIEYVRQTDRQKVNAEWGSCQVGYIETTKRERAAWCKGTACPKAGTRDGPRRCWRIQKIYCRVKRSEDGKKSENQACIGARKKRATKNKKPPVSFLVGSSSPSSKCLSQTPVTPVSCPINICSNPNRCSCLLIVAEFIHSDAHSHAVARYA